MPVIDELEDAVDRFVGVREIDLGQQEIESVVAARVAGEHGGEQLGSDLRQVGSGRRGHHSKSGDLHTRKRDRSRPAGQGYFPHGGKQTSF